MKYEDKTDYVFLQYVECTPPLLSIEQRSNLKGLGLSSGDEVHCPLKEPIVAVGSTIFAGVWFVVKPLLQWEALGLSWGTSYL